MSTLDKSDDLMAQAAREAKAIANALIGIEGPDDEDVAWALKCDDNDRYFFAMSPTGAGPVTVARVHAKRHLTKASAYEDLARVRAGSKFARFRVVKLRGVK